MGNAVYNLKVEFPNARHLRKNFPEIKRFWHQGIKAEKFWQENRDIPRKEFWEAFSKKFPLVTEYLKTVPSTEISGDVRIVDISDRFPTGHGRWREVNSLFGKDNNNDLAGHLDFGWDENVLDNFKIDRNLLTFFADVWHFAEWESIINFLKIRYGALHGKYLSNEYTDEDMVEQFMEAP